jgi:hypothetical protein
MAMSRKFIDPDVFFEETFSDGSGPAFPFSYGLQQHHVFSGMTRREYHASQMMAARLTMGYGESPVKAAEAAVAYADALIAELDK